MNTTKKFPFLFVLLFFTATVYSQTISHKEISIPDILGYKTLKCDLHNHTVFSDGDVWPSLRADEAWLDGLDAIAITDHIEYRPHKEFVSGDFNTSYKIANDRAKAAGVLIIHGAEITRSMPPGHLNALFIEDGNLLNKETWKEAVEETKKQGGILQWNHPGWVAQQPDGIAKWYDEHTWLINTGILKAIEIVNETNYYPEVQQWCLDKNLAMTGNTDSHQPTAFAYNSEKGPRRTMTLVFAKERTVQAIKDAICNGRTAVWANDIIYGKEEYLIALFAESVKLKSNMVNATGKERVYLELQNNSDINFKLELVNQLPEIAVPQSIELKARETAIFQVNSKKADSEIKKEITPEYIVKNMFPVPGKALKTKIALNINIKAKK